jgi:papain like protease
MAEKISLGQLRTQLAGANATWEAGVTSVSQLGASQQQLRLGLIPIESEIMRIQSVLLGATPLRVAFSPARDWRAKDGKNWMTEARDQGNCSSCVAFAVNAVMEAQARISYERPTWTVDLSEADLFFCGAGRKCLEGWWPTYALDYAKNKGVTEESCVPYVAVNSDCSSCADREQRTMFVTDWQEIIDIGARKAHIDTVGPVVACMAIYTDFFSYKRGVYHHVTGELVGYHAVCCVGYSESENCWICKNSWGGGWGDRGFFKIAYGEAEMESTFAMYGISGVRGTLKPADVVEPEPEPEPEPVSPAVIEGENWAETVAVDEVLPRNRPAIWAYVDGRWRSYFANPRKIRALAAVVLSARAVRVRYSGDKITRILASRKYS